MIFGDEIQDWSAINLEIIGRCAGPKTRVIGFGDEKQSLYFFRGAGADSMGAVKARFNAVSLPLSICYRCAKAVVRKAQEYVPSIEAWEESPEGLVIEDATFVTDDFLPTDVILCRNNAPLVETAFRLLRAGKACKVLGRDIGTGLIGLVKKMRAESNDELRRKLDQYVSNEFTTLNPDQQASLLDRVDTIRVFAENCRTPSDVILKIETMFADERGQYLLLATIFRAKGLEWDRVFFLKPELIGVRSKTPGDLITDRNLFYVGITRARHELYFLRSGA